MSWWRTHEGEVAQVGDAGGGPLGDVVGLEAGAGGAAVDGALEPAVPLQPGALECGGMPTEVVEALDRGGLREHSGHEGAAFDRAPRVVDGDGALAGDLAQLAG